MHYVIDACALLAYLNDEEGADKIEDFLKQSAMSDITVSMNIVNLLEVYYGELRDKGYDIAQIVLDMVQHFSIKIINIVSEQVFHGAARLKAVYKLSLADSIGIATAAELDGIFVTCDHHELENIANKEVSLKFFWFR